MSNDEMSPRDFMCEMFRLRNNATDAWNIIRPNGNDDRTSKVCLLI